MAHEPLVSLNRHWAAEIDPFVAEQRARNAIGIAARTDLLVELVDEVAAVGKNKNSAGPRGINEAHRGDRLAGAGGVLEPEALVGIRVIERLGVDVLVGALGGFDQVNLNLNLLDHLVALVVFVLFVLLVERRQLGSKLLVISSNHFDRLVVNVEDRFGDLEIINLHPRCEQRSECAGEGVDLVRVKHRSIS